MTEEVRYLVENPCRRNCKRKLKHVTRFMLGRVSLVGILYCRNSVMEEVRKFFETPLRRNCERN